MTRPKVASAQKALSNPPMAERAPARTIIPVILSGGSGTRLWPLSRESYPKQFIQLMDENSPLQETLLRVADKLFYEDPIIVCAHEHRFVVAEQARLIGITPAAIITEPVGRNTAPAIMAAALKAKEIDPESSILVMPADHKIAYGDKLHDAFSTAARVQSPDHFIIFGAKAVSPATGYGYIQRGEENQDEEGTFFVKRFVEKPNEEKAEQFLAEGDYDWNCGIFLLPVTTITNEIEKLAPDVASAVALAMSCGKKDQDFIHLDEQAFKKSPSISIDYAVMEKTDRALVVQMDCGWSDVGAWSSIWDVSQKDDNNNVVFGDGLIENSERCLVHSKQKLTVLLGMKDTAVITTEDAVLVAPLDKAEEIKTVVSKLRNLKRAEATLPHRMHRPWGWYEAIAKGTRFQVKHIFVRPGQSLSLQMHYHRAEHWVVVAGSALIECAGKETLVKTNESVFIPLGAEHRLKNPGKIDLHLIEVQSGDYLGEDDIVRFADDFGRTGL